MEPGSDIVANDARSEWAPRIVIAGNEQFESEMLRRALERSGYRVEAAADADAAVLALLSVPPDAFVVSENLPSFHRAALTSWLRRTPGLAHLPVVILCGHGDAEHAIREYDAGADLVVFKPLDVDLLGRKLAALVRRTAPANGVHVRG